MQKTVCFTTLGCKVNQYDSQAMLEQFEQHGYAVAPAGAPADVYVVNTCTVTGTGDKKSLQAIRRCRRRNPGAELVVTGCLAQRYKQEILDEIPESWNCWSRPCARACRWWRWRA